MKATSTKPSSMELTHRQLTLLRKKEQMRQQQIRKILLFTTAGLLAVVLFYVLAAAYYRTRFLPRTSINGIAVGGRRVEDAEKSLKNSVEEYTLTVTLRGGEKEMITADDIELTYISGNETAEILSSQNPLLWGPALFGRGESHTVETEFHFDSGKLKSSLASFPEFQKEKVTEPQDAALVQDDTKLFRIRSEIYGNQPDLTAISKMAESAVQHSEHELDLNQEDGAYLSPAVLGSSKDLKEKMDELNAFLSAEVIVRYRDGLAVKLDKETLSYWINYDEEDGYYLSDETLYTNAYMLMSEAAEQYNDVRTTLDFQSTSEVIVRLSCDPYGYKIDVEKGMDSIVEALLYHKKTEITPDNMLMESIDPTFGGTYCEIDVTGQHIWYYESGELILDTDCVTGSESDPDRRTPSGLFYLYNKEQNAVLGSNDPSDPYEVTVDCWMPFYESYGMHDARWRDEFGGDIYKYSGTHGCANMPSDVAHALFDRIEIGMPVIVLRYGDGISDDLP